jgi:hypothetical protein
MKDYLGEILFWGFVIVMTVIFLRDWRAATGLVGGFAGTYTNTVTGLANLGGQAAA